MNKPHVLQSLGWKWDNEGALLNIQIDGKSYMVHVPLSLLQVEFGRHMAGVGCPIDGYSVGGFFGSISRAARKLRRSASKTIRSAGQSVKRVATRFVAPVTKGLSKVLDNSIVRLVASNIPYVSTAYNAARFGLKAANAGLDLLKNPNARTLARGVSSFVSGPSYTPVLDQQRAALCHAIGPQRRQVAYRPMWRPGGVPAGW